MSDRVDRLLRVYRGDVAAVQRRLEIDAKLTLIRFQPKPRPPRSPRLHTPTREAARVWGVMAYFYDRAELERMEREAFDTLVREGVLDPRTGERISVDRDTGRVWRLDPRTRRWFYLDSRGARVYDDD